MGVRGSAKFWIHRHGSTCTRGGGVETVFVLSLLAPRGHSTSEVMWDVDARTVTFRSLSVRDFSQKKGSFSEKAHKSGGQRGEYYNIFVNFSGKIQVWTHLFCEKKVENNGNFDKMSKRGSFDDRLLKIGA